MQAQDLGVTNPGKNAFTLGPPTVCPDHKNGGKH